MFTMNEINVPPLYYMPKGKQILTKIYLQCIKSFIHGFGGNCKFFFFDSRFFQLKNWLAQVVFCCSHVKKYLTFRTSCSNKTLVTNLCYIFRYYLENCFILLVFCRLLLFTNADTNGSSRSGTLVLGNQNMSTFCIFCKIQIQEIE